MSLTKEKFKIETGFNFSNNVDRISGRKVVGIGLGTDIEESLTKAITMGRKNRKPIGAIKVGFNQRGSNIHASPTRMIAQMNAQRRAPQLRGEEKAKQLTATGRQEKVNGLGGGAWSGGDVEVDVLLIGGVVAPGLRGVLQRSAAGQLAAAVLPGSAGLGRGEVTGSTGQRAERLAGLV